MLAGVAALPGRRDAADALEDVSEAAAQGRAFVWRQIEAVARFEVQRERGEGEGEGGEWVHLKSLTSKPFRLCAIHLPERRHKYSPSKNYYR